MFGLSHRPVLLELLRGEKHAEANALASWYAAILEFRRAPRRLHTWDGFEYPTQTLRDPDHPPHHDFEYVAPGSPSDPYVPLLRVAL
jgi:hypothetical protein